MTSTLTELVEDAEDPGCDERHRYQAVGCAVSVIKIEKTAEDAQKKDDDRKSDDDKKKDDDGKDDDSEKGDGLSRSGSGSSSSSS